MAEATEGKCPVMHGAMTSNSSTGQSTKDWWPPYALGTLDFWWFDQQAHDSLKAAGAF